MSSPVEQIKQRLDLVEYIGQFVTLKKAGRNFQGLCPFHNEKSPSFMVSPERQLWHCFGACGEGGDLISFVRKWENCSFGEALQLLAPLAQVTLENQSIDDHSWQERQRLLQATTLAADFFHYILTKHRIGKQARDYLTSRHLSTGTIEQFHIGYAPQSWDSLIHFLQSKKISSNDCIATGLATKGNKGKVFDRFRGRIMFPLTDMRGSILGFSGRILDAAKKEAKYVNTPETTLYHKRELLFGIDKAKGAIKEKQEVILMEGEFDVMLAHQFGYTQSVGIKGTALTTEQIMLLKRLTQTIIFCLDMDKAGIEAIKRGIERAQTYDVSLYVMRLTGGKDPAESLTNDPSKFKQAYKEKVSVYEFLLDTTLERHDVTSVYGKKQAIDELAPLIDTITNPVVRDFFIKKVAVSTATDQSVLLESLRLLKRKSHTRSAPAELPKPKEPLLDEYCVALIVQSPHPAHTIAYAIKKLDLETLSTPAAKELILLLQRYLSSHEQLAAGDEYVEPALRPLFNRSFLMRVPQQETSIERELQKSSLLLKKRRIKRKMKESPDGDEMHTLVQSLGSIEKELQIV